MSRRHRITLDLVEGHRRTTISLTDQRGRRVSGSGPSMASALSLAGSLLEDQLYGEAWSPRSCTAKRLLTVRMVSQVMRGDRAALARLALRLVGRERVAKVEHGVPMTVRLVLIEESSETPKAALMLAKRHVSKGKAMAAVARLLMGSEAEVVEVSAVEDWAALERELLDYGVRGERV